MAVITMGGLAGGGARSLGPIVAEKIGSDYVDRLILANVSRHVGATVEALHQREERQPTRGERYSRILQRILERSAVTGAGGDPYFGPGIPAYLTEEYEDVPQPIITRGHELEDEKYFTAVHDVIHELANQGNVVVVGRGAHIILKNDPNVLRVGVIASAEDRVRTLMSRERLSQSDAEQCVVARDDAREHYFKNFFDIDTPDDPELYHMMVNTSSVSRDAAVDMVVQAANALVAGKFRREAIATV